MADPAFEKNLLADLRREAGAIATLVANQQQFTDAFKAFRAGDRNAFQTVLRRLKLLPLCDLVCEWIRIKECVFLCFEICGPPKPVDKPPDIHLLAQSIVRITADPKLLQELVQIVEKRDT